MPSVNVKVSASDKRTYTGQVNLWPDGVYQSFSSFFDAFRYFIKCGDNIVFLDSTGTIRTWGQGMVAAGSYTQITNHPVIQEITFAGSIE